MRVDGRTWTNARVKTQPDVLVTMDDDMRTQDAIVAGAKTLVPLDLASKTDDGAAPNRESVDADEHERSNINVVAQLHLVRANERQQWEPRVSAHPMAGESKEPPGRS
ncbi:MAG: hypothetical protein IPK15_20710 [Verrucomicrobia bacterium]|nr:hypothetical protein [Verrucomicrobiota bacterium]